MIPLREDFGVNKTLEKIRKRFYWTTCKQDVEHWCENCKICIARKEPSNKEKSALQIFNSGVPFEKVQMDSRPITNFFLRKQVFVSNYCFTKWVEVLSKVRSKTIAKIMVKQVISRFGVPLELHTDQGKNFESKMFQELIQLLEIKKITIPFHPQFNRQVECQHRMLLDYLAKFISENQKDWDCWISLGVLAYRSSKHETNGFIHYEFFR